MNEKDMDLTDRLRRLAGAVPREAGPDVERKLIAAFRERRKPRMPVWIYAAVAACLAFAAGLTLWRKQPAAPEKIEHVFNAPGFVALPYSQSGVPMESAVVIRVRLHPYELSSMGVAVPASASAANVKADILVGQDGVARAVRLVE